MTTRMTSQSQSPYELLVAALTGASWRMGGKHTLVRYLRNYYYEINTEGDKIVNEMIDVFEEKPILTPAMFVIKNPDTDLVALCARHIVEDALTTDKLAAWMACQRSK